MRINDAIYFSPQLHLKDLNLSNRDLVIKSFYDRILGYYFEPIDILLQSGQAFAAGAIECLLIDTFARYSTGMSKVGDRIVKWCEENLGVSNSVANDFYHYIRCGLFHEGHIKNYAQFSFDREFDKPIERKSNFIIVNPICLFGELKKFLDRFATQLASDARLYQIFIDCMKEDFQSEVERAKRG